MFLSRIDVSLSPSLSPSLKSTSVSSGAKEERKESTVDIDLCSTPEKGEMWPKASAETVAGVWL